MHVYPCLSWAKTIATPQPAARHPFSMPQRVGRTADIVNVLSEGGRLVQGEGTQNKGVEDPVQAPICHMQGLGS